MTRARRPLPAEVEPAPSAAVPIYVRIPVDGFPWGYMLRDYGLRRHGPHGWTGRLKPGNGVERVAEIAASWAGALHVTGRPGEAPRRLTEDAVLSLPPPEPSAWHDALRRYYQCFKRGPVAGQRPLIFTLRPEDRPRAVAMLNAAVDRGAALDDQEVEALTMRTGA